MRALILLLVVSGGACAAPLFLVATCTPAPLPLAISQTDRTGSASGTLSCPQFDPVLGTLVDVGSPYPFDSLNGSFTIFNSSASAFTGSFLAFDAHLEIGPLPGFGSRTFFGPLGTPTTTIGAGATVTINAAPFSVVGGGFLSPISDAAYIGTGQILAPVQLTFFRDLAPDNRPSELLLTDWMANIDLNFALVYRYEPIPEPGVPAMLISGLGAILACRRRVLQC